MERSFGVRLGRPFGLAIPRGRAPTSRRPPRGSARAERPVGPRRGPPGIPAGAVGLTSASLAAVWRRRRVRVALLCLLVALPLLAGGWLWLRSSPLVAVEHVRVSGLITSSGADSTQIEGALVHAARGMSTLDVNSGRLRAAVASFPIVSSVRAHPSFPHSLRIEVREQPPVAALAVAGVRSAVAADGVVLGSGYLSGALPVLSVENGAASSLPAVGGRVRDGSLREALAVLGAAPAALAQVVEKAYSGPKGLTIALRGGLLAYFGDATRPHAKWLSLARVLADPSSAGATYVDVRVPEAPVAGFAPGTARPTPAGEGEATSVAEPATAQALAAGLNAALGVKSSPAAGGNGAATGAGAAASGSGTGPSGAGAAASGSGAAASGSGTGASGAGEPAASESGASEVGSSGSAPSEAEGAGKG